MDAQQEQQPQQPKEITARITGYRQLSEEEQALINAIKAHASGLELLLSEVHAHLGRQVRQATNDKDQGELGRIDDAQPARWAAMARTDFQTGLMALVRAVAQPTTF